MVARRHGLAAVPATVAVSVFAVLSFVPLYALLAATGVVTSHLRRRPGKSCCSRACFRAWARW